MYGGGGLPLRRGGGGRSASLTPDGRIAFTFHNVADRPLRWTGRVHLEDAFGRTAEVPFDVTVEVGSFVHVPLAGRLPAKGWWRARAEIHGTDKSTAAAETSLAWLDPHVVTPRLGADKFRMGLHVHTSGRTPRLQERLLDALVACGAKLVRTELGTRRHVQPTGPDDRLWAAQDRLVDAFLGRGIDIDALCWSNPRWAAAPDLSTYCRDADCVRRKHPEIWHACRPVDLPLSEDFFTMLAARYRGRIAFYEIGNEWELMHFYPGTIEDAIDILKSCARGLRRGDANAVVSTCGFAKPDSDWKLIVNTNIHERLVGEAKGAYDVHAVHLHGTFRAYRTELLDRFFPMRRRLGVTAPWFSNETALSTVYGNETQVGEELWKKILFAWANGSRGFVWYNLRGTGWDPRDPEQGYGLLTADLKPRPGFASFSALTALLNGFDYVRTVQSEKDGMEVYLFRGMHGGCAERIVAGWRNRRHDGGDMRFRTDAARAWVVDHMGNRTPQAIEGGPFVGRVHPVRRRSYWRKRRRWRPSRKILSRRRCVKPSRLGETSRQREPPTSYWISRARLSAPTTRIRRRPHEPGKARRTVRCAHGSPTSRMVSASAPSSRTTYMIHGGGSRS